MDVLRRECPWDREQTHASLLRYLVEETYEVVDAVERRDREALREELGDVLLQVVFHARIAAEAGTDGWDIDDVAGDLVGKLVRRHPHVFAGVHVDGADQVARNWEEIKHAEKGRRSPLDGLPRALPALALAEKVIDRLLRSDGKLSIPVRSGYAAPTVADEVSPIAHDSSATVAPDDPSTAPLEGSPTVADEVSPTTHDSSATASGWTSEHLGDVLFALVAAAYEQGIDAEQALRDRVRREITTDRTRSS